MEGAEHLDERAGVGAMGLARGFDLDRQETVGGMKDEIDFVSGVRGEEVERRRLRLPWSGRICLGRAEREKTPPLAPAGEQLRRVQEPGLLLHIVEEHEASAVIESAHRIGGQAQAFLGIVEREVDRCRPARGRQQVMDERCLAGLPRARAGGEPEAWRGGPPRVHGHRDNAFSLAARFPGEFAAEVKRP